MFNYISIKRTFFITVLSALGFVSSGCSSGDSPSTGTLNLSVTDAVVDTADKVVVEFNGVTINDASGTQQEFTFPTKQIDLLSLQGGVAEILLDGQTLGAGNYSWIRLHVNETNSYIVVSGTQHPLVIPGGSQSGLKLNRAFTIPPDGLTSFTIDFDLRKSVVLTGAGVYQLRPTLRIVDDFTQGTLTGTVDSNVLAAECTNASVYSGAVYVFESNVVSADDVDGSDPDPITSALVDLSSATYTVGFLEAGDYQISYTCNGDMDSANTNDDAVVSFTPLIPVTIIAGATTTQDITP